MADGPSPAWRGPVNVISALALVTDPLVGSEKGDRGKEDFHASLPLLGSFPWSTVASFRRSRLGARFRTPGLSLPRVAACAQRSPRRSGIA